MENIVSLASFKKKREEARKPAPEAIEWQREVAHCCLDKIRAYPDMLNELVTAWEMEFLNGMAEWCGLPSERQKAVLERIEAKILRALNGPPAS